ncbi:MAG: protein kinase domain-containing protein, partial [Gemmatimonadales bacterium]
MNEEGIGRLGSEYRFERRLGGSSGEEVWLARDLALDRLVILRTFPIDGGAVPKALTRLAGTLSRLNHPNIVTVHRAESDTTPPYVVMEYLPGESLAARLANGPLSVTEVIRLGDDLLGALAAVHGAGIVH